MSVVLHPGDQIYLNIGANTPQQAEEDFDRMAVGFRALGIHIVGWSWSTMATGVSIGYVVRKPQPKGWTEATRG